MRKKNWGNNVKTGFVEKMMKKLEIDGLINVMILMLTFVTTMGVSTSAPPATLMPHGRETPSLCKVIVNVLGALTGKRLILNFQT